MKSPETMPEDDKISEADMRALQELSDDKSSRHGMTVFVNDEIEQFVRKHNLAIKEIPRWSPDHPRRVAVAKKEIVRDALGGSLGLIKIPQITGELKELYEKIKNLPVIEAVEFLDQYPRLPNGNMEAPEVAALDGLVFGYKPCDIDYYLQTRYFSAPRHEYEKSTEVVEYVMCEPCAKKYFSEPKISRQ